MTSQPPSGFQIGAGAGDSQGSALQGLDRRSRDIFRSIVESYLDTGEPVGSRNISRLLPMSLSPASVRNVMADLEQLGLIYAPHTSAGRLPTEYGLRFFVDALLEIGDLSVDERRSIESQMRANEPGRTMESLLNEASQALSGLSRGAGVVLSGKTDLRLKHVEFVRIESSARDRLDQQRCVRRAQRAQPEDLAALHHTENPGAVGPTSRRDDSDLPTELVAQVPEHGER